MTVFLLYILLDGGIKWFSLCNVVMKECFVLVCFELPFTQFDLYLFRLHTCLNLLPMGDFRLLRTHFLHNIVQCMGPHKLVFVLVAEHAVITSL